MRRKRLFTFYEMAALGMMGVMLGNILVLVERYSNAVPKPAPFQKSERIREASSKPVLYSRNIDYCTSLCYTPPEVPKPQEAPRRRPAVKTAPPGTMRVAAIPPDAKNPNAIRISLREAPPILAEVKMVNGRPTCAKKKDKPRKSKKTDSVHIDQECCLDPDEVPNPRCLYQ